jgi:hypothetical protein
VTGDGPEPFNGDLATGGLPAFRETGPPGIPLPNRQDPGAGGLSGHIDQYTGQSLFYPGTMRGSNRSAASGMNLTRQPMRHAALRRELDAALQELGARFRRRVYGRRWERRRPEWPPFKSHRLTPAELSVRRPRSKPDGRHQAGSGRRAYGGRARRREQSPSERLSPRQSFALQLELHLLAGQDRAAAGIPPLHPWRERRSAPDRRGGTRGRRPLRRAERGSFPPREMNTGDRHELECPRSCDPPVACLNSGEPAMQVDLRRMSNDPPLIVSANRGNCGVANPG